MFKRSLGLVLASMIASSASIAAVRTLSAYPSPFGYKRNGPGWTAAHVKRMAKKARNQKRHRKAVKGGA